MPDAGGNIRGIALSGKAGEVLERIKREAAEQAERDLIGHQKGSCRFPACECEGHQDDCPAAEYRQLVVEVQAYNDRKT